MLVDVVDVVLVDVVDVVLVDVVDVVLLEAEAKLASIFILLMILVGMIRRVNFTFLS